jgi:uncharacterized protein
MELCLLSGEFTVARFPTGSAPEMLPPQDKSGFLSVTWTDEECSVVCKTQDLPAGFEVTSDGWAILKIVRVLDFGLVGVLASIITPLGRAGVSVFTISTYNTDYVLVKADTLDSTVAALRSAGFIVGIK